MLKTGKIAVTADDLISIEVGNVESAQQLARSLQKTGSWIEAVGGIDSVVVQFDPASTDSVDALDTLQAELHAASREDTDSSAVIKVPVIYGGDDGPDLDALCESLEMSRNELIVLHCRDEYRVEMIGFTPGFAYVGGLDQRLDVPRLAHPRQHVAAGSIGIAGGRTGVYALPGPGGWPIIGRTPMRLYDPHAPQPFRLQPGARVRFEPAGPSVG